MNTTDQHQAEDLDQKYNSDNGFRYCKIDKRREIRLLRTVQRVDGRSYEFVVVPVHLLSHTIFTAISYTWGSAKLRTDIHPIKIDGQTFFLRGNVLSALQTLQTWPRRDLIYVDAACMNQRDIHKKQEQVRLMRRIYASATEVVAWLGQPPHMLQAAVRAFGTMLKHAPLRPANSWAIEHRNVFQHLCNASYWTRLWIVPEVLFARKITILYGDTPFDWNAFSRLQDGTLWNPFFETERTDAHQSQNASYPSIDFHSQEELEITSGLRWSHALRIFDSRTKWHERRFRVPLYQAISIFQDLQCSDQRDKLYGIIGLLKSKPKYKIEPDYRKDIYHTYRQALARGLAELQDRKLGPVIRQGYNPVLMYAAFCHTLLTNFKLSFGETIKHRTRVMAKLGLRERWREVKHIYRKEVFTVKQVDADFELFLAGRDSELIFKCPPSNASHFNRAPWWPIEVDEAEEEEAKDEDEVKESTSETESETVSSESEEEDEDTGFRRRSQTSSSLRPANDRSQNMRETALPAKAQWRPERKAADSKTDETAPDLAVKGIEVPQKNLLRRTSGQKEAAPREATNGIAAGRHAFAPNAALEDTGQKKASPGQATQQANVRREAGINHVATNDVAAQRATANTTSAKVATRKQPAVRYRMAEEAGVRVIPHPNINQEKTVALEAARKEAILSEAEQREAAVREVLHRVAAAREAVARDFAELDSCRAGPIRHEVSRGEAKREETRSVAGSSLEITEAVRPIESNDNRETARAHEDNDDLSEWVVVEAL